MHGQILWWGRFAPDYSRNRILRQGLKSLGFDIVDFRPKASRFAGLEANLRGIKTPALIWVPCFRQRDVFSAVKWGRQHHIPVLFDPLISSYDKQVDERKKLHRDSRAAKRLLTWEQRIFNAADMLLADTLEHQLYFQQTLKVPPERIAVVPVGAEEGMFRVSDDLHAPTAVKTILFYGSYLHLQGPEVIVQAAKIYHGPPVKWLMIGSGPLLGKCKELAAGQDNIDFVDAVPYAQLPGRIQQADILLGVFGITPKAGRVIPNKVYQALACGKPLITRSAAAYPAKIANSTDSGIFWVEPGQPAQLAARVAELVSQPASLIETGRRSRQTYDNYFSQKEINDRLKRIVSSLTNERTE